MKIEKINDSQIRCTLTSADLERRQIRLSELAYGSDKARLLFQDMMQEAHQNYGFDTGNSPLMIEAIPLSPDSIVLIITKVDDPEELDTRFSKFSPSRPEPGSSRSFSGADDLLDLFRQLREKQEKESRREAEQKPAEKAEKKETQARPGSSGKGQAGHASELIRAYRFDSLQTLIKAARALNGFYRGKNLLVKDAPLNCYDLILHQSECSPEDFNKVCNILTEYGEGRAFSAAAEAYLTEHGDVLLPENALGTLAG